MKLATTLLVLLVGCVSVESGDPGDPACEGKCDDAGAPTLARCWAEQQDVMCQLAVVPTSPYLSTMFAFVARPDGGWQERAVLEPQAANAPVRVGTAASLPIDVVVTTAPADVSLRFTVSADTTAAAPVAIRSPFTYASITVDTLLDGATWSVDHTIDLGDWVDGPIVGGGATASHALHVTYAEPVTAFGVHRSVQLAHDGSGVPYTLRLPDGTTQTGTFPGSGNYVLGRDGIVAAPAHDATPPLVTCWRDGEAQLCQLAAALPGTTLAATANGVALGAAPTAVPAGPVQLVTALTGVTNGPRWLEQWQTTLAVDATHTAAAPAALRAPVDLRAISVRCDDDGVCALVVKARGLHYATPVGDRIGEPLGSGSLVIQARQTRDFVIAFSPEDDAIAADGYVGEAAPFGADLAAGAYAVSTAGIVRLP